MNFERGRKGSMPNKISLDWRVMEINGEEVDVLNEQSLKMAVDGSAKGNSRPESFNPDSPLNTSLISVLSSFLRK